MNFKKTKIKNCKLKKIAEVNPDLPIEFIERILIARGESRTDKLKPYKTLIKTQGNGLESRD